MRVTDDQRIVPPEVTLRIPGTWSKPADFFERLPADCRTTESGLVLADGAEFELHVLPADEEFPRIFAGSCPKLPTRHERDEIENYKVNMCVTGRGGSVAAAIELMAAGAAIVAAGGAGVFVDNSGIAHGATDWLTLLESADDGGVYWAFVSAVQSDREVYSLGMHILGCRDAIIPSTGNQEYDARTLHSFLGFSVFRGVPIQDGEIIRDTVLPTFRAHFQPDDRVPTDAPMFNPYGRWRLERLEAERN